MPSFNQAQYGRQFTEKRRELRMQVQAKVSLTDATLTHVGTSQNLSASGCALTLARELPIGAFYQLSLQASLRSEHYLTATFEVLRVSRQTSGEYLVAGRLSNVL